MNRYQKLLGTIFLGSILLFGLWGIASSAKEVLKEAEYSERESHNSYNKYSATLIKQDAIYLEECGSCHMAYPAELLPTESWQNIMTGLNDHFTENAELDKETTAYIGNYLEQNALSRSKPSRFSRLLRNIPDSTPLRITDLPYFVHEHDEIPSRMVDNNPEVISFSNCERCHKDAAGGFFDEDQVIIPGFGRWDD